MISSKELAWHLHQYREHLGITQEDAAKALGLDATAISKIEHNTREVSAVELLQFTKFYNMPIGMFQLPEHETIWSLYPDALKTTMMLINREEISSDQLLRLGLFFGEVSRLLKGQGEIS
ncbi:MAG TPA: helix-turn-helix transcriptional regulator [Ktedonobacteraceae bacterium]|nr:helix-turn-helix transcriptional regulator [Ktedonobacteraceae bacterium]